MMDFEGSRESISTMRSTGMVVVEFPAWATSSMAAAGWFHRFLFRSRNLGHMTD